MENKTVTLREITKIAARRHSDFTVTDDGIIYNAPYDNGYTMDNSDIDNILSDATEQEIPVDESIYNYLVENMGYDTARVEGRDKLRPLIEDVCADYEGRGYTIEILSEMDEDERDEEIDEAAGDFDVNLPLESYKLLFPELRMENGAAWDTDKEAYMPDTWANVD